MPAVNSELRGICRLLMVLSVIFVVVWLTPALGHMQGDLVPLPMHIAVETFAIVIAMMVFGITWNAYSEERSTNTLILACGFLLVGLLDFGHMFSFKGMPDFVTPSSPEKAIQFWLAGRFAAALLLLAVAIRPWEPFAQPKLRFVLLGYSLATAGAFYWLVLFHGQELPHTFIEGKGLTATKVGAEYLVIAILLVAGALFYRQSQQPSAQSTDEVNLFAACMVTVLSELCFVLYSAVSDLFNLLGHVFKIIAYVFIYRAAFINSVRAPYRRLDNAKAALRSSQLMLESIISSVPVAIFWKDRNGRFLGANELLLRDIGIKDERQLIGKDDYDFFPEEQARKFQAEDDEVMRSATSKLNFEEPILTVDGRPSWLLTSKAPLLGSEGEVVGVLGAFIDITSLREAEIRLEHSNEQLRELTVRREEAREDERKRIARDLHDELGQILTALRMDVSMLRIRFGQDNPQLADQVKNILESVDSTIQVVRNVASKLRPSVLDMGIAAALEWQVEEFSKRCDIRFELSVCEESVVLDDERATAVFRIVQESITNVIRHAEAKTVNISLTKQDAEYVLEIVDDGKGFLSEESGKRTFGLMGIRERGMTLDGTVDIRTAPGKGTRIIVRIPVKKGPKR